MTKYLIVFVLIAVFAYGMEFFRKRSLDKLLNEIYQAAYVRKDEEAFELLVLSPQAKMLMNKATRLLMKLNYYVSNDKEIQVIETVKKLKQCSLNNANKKAFYGSAIGYFAEKENNEAKKLLEWVKEKESDSKDAEMKMLLYDCELTVDIYINKNINRIHDLEVLVTADIDDNAKSVYQYRLAKLYDAAKERKKCIEQLKLALKNTKSKQAKKKIERILNGEWNLL